MEADRIEIARVLAEAIEARDFAAIERVTDPQVEFHSRLAAAEGRTYHGHDGFRRYFDDAAEAWESFHFDFREFTAVGDHVVVEYEGEVLGRGSGVELETTLWSVAEFSGDSASSIHTFADRDEAFAHARPAAEIVE